MSTFKTRIEDYVGSVNDDTFLGDALTDTASEVLRALPVSKLGYFSEETDDQIYNGINIENMKLLSVVRENGTDGEYVECKEVSPSYFRKAQDTNSMFAGTIETPVYTIKNSKVHVFPAPAASPNAVKLETVSFPTVLASQSDMAQVSITDATCDTTNGSASVTMDSTANLSLGLLISGTGIQTGSRVAIINSATQFTMTKNATATNSNQTFTFTSDKLPDKLEDVIVLGATAKAVQYLMARVKDDLPSTPTLDLSGISAPNTPNAPNITYNAAQLGNATGAASNAIDEAQDPVASAQDAYTGEEVLFTDATCDTTNTSTNVTIDSTSSLRVGMTVSGTGIPANTTISSITNATTFVISNAATATNSNQTFIFSRVTANATASTSSEGSSAAGATANASADSAYTSPAIEGASVDTKGLLSMSTGTINNNDDQIDYDKWWNITAEFIEEEEDAELANLQMEKIRTYIAAFNSEVADAQNAMQATISDARLATDAAISTARDETQASIQNARNAHEEAFLNARLQSDASTTNARIDASIEEASISSKTAASTAKMRESTGAAISKMNNSTSAAIAKMRESTGAAVAQMQASTNVNVQNAARTLEASIQDYAQEVDNFRVDIQRFSAQISSKVNEYTSKIQQYSSQVDRYVREYSWYQDQYARFDAKFKEALQVVIEN